MNRPKFTWTLEVRYTCKHGNKPFKRKLPPDAAADTDYVRLRALVLRIRLFMQIVDLGWPLNGAFKFRLIDEEGNYTHIPGMEAYKFWPAAPSVG